MGLGTLQRKLSPVAKFAVDYGGLIYVFVVGSVLYYLTSFVVAPAIFSAEFCETLEFWAWFIIFECSLNLACFQYYQRDNCVSFWQRVSCVADLCRHSDEVEDYVRYGVDDPRAQVADAKYCVDCNRKAPIRSHHCPLCNICVLRKDHHCFITGGCVGLGNQRFFIVFVFWAMIGTGLASIFLVQYLDKTILPWYPFGWIHYIAPIALVKWFLAKELLYNVLVCVAFSFGVACCVASLAFFTIQMFYTCHGYTMFEYHSLGIREEFDGDGASVGLSFKYSVSFSGQHSRFAATCNIAEQTLKKKQDSSSFYFWAWSPYLIGERFRLVFGSYWLVNFLVPAVWWPQRLTPEIANNLFRVRSKLL